MSENNKFSQRVMPHSRKMFAVAYRYLQNQEEAEDVVQDVLTKLWQMRDKMPPDDEELLPYLLTITRNISIDRTRQLKTVCDEVCSCIDHSSDSDIQSALENKERLRGLMELIRQLPLDQQRALKLKVLDDLSTEQIALLTGWQTDNIRQLISRARRKLKEMALTHGLL